MSHANPDTPIIRITGGELRVNTTTMVDVADMQIPLKAGVRYEVSFNLRFNRSAGAPASSLKFNWNNTFTLQAASVHGVSTLLNTYGADYNAIPDNAAADTVLNPVILGVQYRWIASGIIVPVDDGDWVLEFAQAAATTTAVLLANESWMKAVPVGAA